MKSKYVYKYSDCRANAAKYINMYQYLLNKASVDFIKKSAYNVPIRRRLLFDDRLNLLSLDDGATF